MFKKEAVFIFLVLFVALIFYSGDVDGVACRDVGYCSGLPHSSQGSSTVNDAQGNIYCYYKAVVAGASGCAGRVCYEQDKVICNKPNTCTAEGCKTGSCTPKWECSSWGTCGADGTQTRSCSDVNNCGTTSGRPELAQFCTPSQPASTPTPTQTQPSQPTTKPVATPSTTGPETCYERNVGEKCVDLCNAKGQTCVYNNKFSDQPCSKGKGAGSLGATGGSEFNVPCTRAPAGDIGKCAYWCAGAVTPSQPSQPVATSQKSTVQLAKKVVSCEGIYDLYPVGKPDAKIDLNDFFEFATKYGNKDLTVDYRKDGVLDLDDFGCFERYFGGVPTVTAKDCLGLNGNQNLDPDYNNDGKVDDADLLKFYQCGGIFLSGPAPSKEICKKFDFDNDGKVDFSGGFYDGACFSVFYKQNLNCKGSNICSDSDRSGEIDFNDVFNFINCFESKSSDCLTKFDYSGNREVDAIDYLCLKKDFGKPAKEVSICIPGMACSNDNECGPLGSDYYCSFGDRGKRSGNEVGGCCNRKVGEVFDIRRKVCLPGAGELDCNCPFEQEEGTGRFKGPKGYITSKEFVSNAACKALEKVCVLTKRYTRQDAPKEKRKLTVEVYGKK